MLRDFPFEHGGTKNRFFKGLLLKISTGFIIFLLGIGQAFAVALTNMSDTLSSAKINTASNHTIVFTTPTGIAAGSTTLIFFSTSTGNSEFAIM